MREVLKDYGKKVVALEAKNEKLDQQKTALQTKNDVMSAMLKNLTNMTFPIMVIIPSSEVIQNMTTSPKINTFR